MNIKLHLQHLCQQSMKTYIETWYENNMTAYTSYLEDTTYCNDRSILNLNSKVKCLIFSTNEKIQ